MTHLPDASQRRDSQPSWSVIREGWRTHRLVAVLGLLAGGSLLGCHDQPEITRYQTPKVAPVEDMAPAATAPTRLLAAMIPHGGAMWFLKTTTIDARAAEIVEPFREIATSFSFNDDGQPAWKLPEGWQEIPGDSIRFKTLRATLPDGPVDISVTTLPLPTGEPKEYLLANVNRWRGQIGLSELAPEQLADEFDELRTSGGDPVYICDFLGVGAGVPPPMGGPPLNELIGFVPPGWQSVPGSTFSAAAFRVLSDDGKDSADITVTSLALAGGNLLDNINRWRGQIRLDPTTAESLANEAAKLTISGRDASYCVLVSDPETGPHEAILGVVAPRADRVWFVKLRGPATLAENQRENFEGFAKGLRLP